VPPRVPAGVQEGTHQDLVRYFGTEGFVNRLKGWTAMLGSLLLALIVGLTWKPESFDFPKAFKVALASLGIFGAALWWNLGNFHYPSSVHTWELFHYYVGAKYFPELGYTRLYDCSSVADLEDGFASGVHANKIRNLATNALEPTDRIVRAPRSCTDHFSSERWRAFKRDVGWFRGQMDTTRWSDLKRDHGFNGSPVWLILGRLFSAGGTISWDSAYFLVSLDTLFLGLLWALVWRAFGWQSACVAALVWGTNFPGRYYWVGGSLLRQDWMFALVGGICCLKLEKMRLGGALLCYSALLRVFPGFAGVPLVLGVLLEVMRQRRIVWNSPGIKFLQGGILALLVLVPLSLVSSGRWSAYQEFSANSKKHLATPLTNNMGLQTILGYSQDERARVLKDPAALEPFALWKESRLEHKSARFWLFVLIVGGYAAYITFLSRRLELWETAILGVGLIPFAAELTCYYYSFLLVYGLLWKRAPAIGMLAVLLAWVTCETAASIEWTDESYTLMSAWVLVFVVLAAWLMSRISVQRDNQALPLSEA
jgi:hypothetical protein